MRDGKRYLLLIVGINSLLTNSWKEGSDHLPLSVAAFRLFRDIRNYNKIGSLKKELSALCLQKYAINEACSCESQVLIS
jgi:hypothetical protein